MMPPVYFVWIAIAVAAAICTCEYLLGNCSQYLLLS